MFVSPENHEKLVKNEVFENIKKNGSNDFDKNLHEDRRDGYEAAEKNRRSKSFWIIQKCPIMCNYRGFF